MLINYIIINTIQKRDTKKKELCFQNGIKLKYILDFNEKTLFNLL